MKKIAIAIIILALIGAGFYIGKNMSSSSNNNSLIQNTNTNSNNNNNATSSAENSSSQNMNNSSNNQENSENTTQNNSDSVKKLSTRTNTSSNASNSNNEANKSSNSQSSNQNLGITVSKIPQGYGEFGGLVQPANQEAINGMPNGPMFLQLTVVINSQNVVLDIDVTNVGYVGKLLVLKGHYLNKPFEQFTYYVSNTSTTAVDGPHTKPQYTMYEFYNGVNTAVFKLTFQGAANYGGLTGTYNHVGSDKTYQCQGPFINPNPPSGDYLGAFPYYNGLVNNTKVTLATTNVNTTFKEKYVNDSNTFSVNEVPMPTQFKHDDYQFALEESYNGQITGLYLLSLTNSNDELNGIFIPRHNGSFNVQNYLAVTLSPSLSPEITW